MAESLSCTTETFETLKDGTQVSLYRINGGRGITAEILSYGGIIHRLYAPDKHGQRDDIVLGQPSVERYGLSPNCAAPVIGRVINRIGEGQFMAGGKLWQTEINAQGNCTNHSGSGNYARRHFSGEPFEGPEAAGVKLYLKDNGEGGFPGTMDVWVTYSLDQEGNLKIFYEALPDHETPINISNHVYFNLSGHASGSTKDQLLQLDADFVMTFHENGMPLGEIISVKDTDLDFTSLRPLGQGYDSQHPQLSLKGYDHNYCIRGRGLRRGGMAQDLNTGRALEFFTDMPGVQLYTGIHLFEGICPGKDDAQYRNGCGFCLETQHYPNAMNFSQFPSPMYQAGEKFESTTVFRFYTV
ncbi:MAG: galactose mutarotase [Treponema sp.]|nr:galactose mutarotase [Treponema sp.]